MHFNRKHEKSLALHGFWALVCFRLKSLSMMTSSRLHQLMVTLVCYFPPVLLFSTFFMLMGSKIRFQTSWWPPVLELIKLLGGRNVLQKGLFSVRIMNWSWVLNFWQNFVRAGSGKPGLSHGKVCFPTNSRKISGK